MTLWSISIPNSSINQEINNFDINFNKIDQICNKYGIPLKEFNFTESL